MSYKEIIAKNLNTAVRQSDLTNAEIAKRVGVSPGAVSNWTNATTSIDLEHLIKMCMTLNLSLDAVCNMKEDYPYRAVTTTERELLIAFRSADPKARFYANLILHFDCKYY